MGKAVAKYGVDENGFIKIPPVQGQGLTQKEADKLFRAAEIADGAPLKESEKLQARIDAATKTT